MRENGGENCALLRGRASDRQGLLSGFGPSPWVRRVLALRVEGLPEVAMWHAVAVPPDVDDVAVVQQQIPSIIFHHEQSSK